MPSKSRIKAAVKSVLKKVRPSENQKKSKASHLAKGAKAQSQASGKAERPAKKNAAQSAVAAKKGGAGLSRPLRLQVGSKGHVSPQDRLQNRNTAAVKAKPTPNSKPAPNSGKKVSVASAGKSVIAKGTGSSKVAGGKSARERGGVKESSHGGPTCREVACELIATTGRYCRLHYIKNWKKIKRKELILKEKKLDSYIEELVSKYPEKYIDAIRQDLASEKDFAKVISELEIEDFSADEYDSENAPEAVVEEIIDTAKRTEFDDEDEFGF